MAEHITFFFNNNFFRRLQRYARTLCRISLVVLKFSYKNLNNFFADYDDMPVPCVGYLSSFKISYKNLNTFSRTTTYARTLCRIS